MTFYVIVSVRTIQDFNGLPWMIYDNCTESDRVHLAGFAVDNWLLNRGGLADDEDRLTLHVYVRDTDKLPCDLEYTEFEINKTRGKTA